MLRFAPMRRLSREESQARTRERLLRTARTCFLRDGYGATSLEGIAKAAGFSKGAVYSNFRNKDELCLLVLEGIRAERGASLAAAVEKRRSFDGRVEALVAWAGEHLGDRAWTALEFEFAVHAARDPALASALVERQRSLHALVAGLSAVEAERDGRVLAVEPADAALLLLGAGVGLGVMRAVDPALSVSALGALARLIARPRQAGQSSRRISKRP